MISPRLRRCLFILIAVCGFSAARADSVWQWSAPVKSVISPETNGNPRAFLWIPPGCQRVRGVVLGQHNMQEEMIFQSRIFRKAMADLNFAIIWITPPLDLFFRFDKGSATAFDEMFQALAGESGYSELTKVPVVPLGHSAAASYPWNFGALHPERTLAAVSVSGQWPYYIDQNTPDWGGRTVDGVPGLVTMGEYESALDRTGAGLDQRARHPLTPLSMLAEPSGEHFAATDDKTAFIAAYIATAARHRLPADWPLDEAPELKPIDPTKTGWLVDRARAGGKPTAPAAPVGKYKGDPKQAFWAFDGEQAHATDAFQARYTGQTLSLLGYVQKDGVAVQNPRQHVRVALKFEPGDDGRTFRLRGTYLDTVPCDWRGLVAGAPVSHPASTAGITITPICGPVKKIGADTFALQLNRVGMDNRKRSNSICFILRDQGDATHRPMALEAEMKIPFANTAGSEQSLAFELPKTVRSGISSIPLAARSSAGLPVEFYVREGPAEVEDSTLLFTPIPPRAKFPVKVTVVAWQWGRSLDPKVKSAPPVERTLEITKSLPDSRAFTPVP